MKKITLTLLPALFAVALFAQDRSTFYTNTFVNFTRNAAYTGTEENTNIFFDSRIMGGNIDGRFQNIQFGAHSMIADNNALGLKLLADNVGPLRNVNAELNFAKNFKLAENHFLALGTNAGFIQTAINTSALSTYVDMSDPTISNGYFNQYRFTAGFGAHYQFKKIIDAGLSFPMLVTGNSPVNPTTIVNVSYAYSKSDETGTAGKWKFIPGLVYYNITQKSMLDASLKCSWNDFISLSAGYRTNGSLLTALMVNTKSFTLGYAFNYSTGNVNNLYMGTNEILLSFGISSLNKRQKPVNDSNLPTVENKLQEIKNNLSELAKAAGTMSAEDLKKGISKNNAELRKLLKEYKTDNVEKLLDEKGGFIYAHWDGTGETEQKIKEETKATIRCIPLDNKQEAGKCIYSGKPSTQRVVFARAY